MNTLSTAPDVTFTYQGAYLSLLNAGITVGPFHVAAPDQIGVGHAVAQDILSTVPVTTVRTASIKADMAGGPDGVIQMGYLQNDTEWLMTFSVLSDPQGGMVGTDFALQTHSNYPQIPMNIGRTRFTEKGINYLVKGILPKNYRAQLVLQFWNNGLDKLALDAWMSVQVGYVQVSSDQHRSLSDGVSVPLVTVGETLFHPAPGSGDPPVNGNSYPARDRFKEPRIVTL